MPQVDRQHGALTYTAVLTPSGKWVTWTFPMECLYDCLSPYLLWDIWGFHVWFHDISPWVSSVFLPSYELPPNTQNRQTSLGTAVYDADGSRIKGLSSVVFHLHTNCFRLFFEKNCQGFFTNVPWQTHSVLVFISPLRWCNVLGSTPIQVNVRNEYKGLVPFPCPKHFNMG